MVAADERLAEGRQGSRLFGHRLRKGLGAAEVVGECQVDHAVGFGNAGAKDIEVGESPPQSLGAGCLGGLSRRVGAGEHKGGVTVAQKLGDDGRPDETSPAGDKDAHEVSPSIMSVTDI